MGWAIFSFYQLGKDWFLSGIIFIAAPGLSAQAGISFWWVLVWEIK